MGQPSDYPTLSGDFFPYMDGPGGHPYWTGFFTTRPYFKRLERIIESRLRGTDLLSAFSLGAGDWHKTTKPRRDLALFQHHDAITGTSTVAVMNDYLHRFDYDPSSFRKYLSLQTFDIVDRNDETTGQIGLFGSGC